MSFLSIRLLRRSAALLFLASIGHAAACSDGDPPGQAAGGSSSSSSASSSTSGGSSGQGGTASYCAPGAQKPCYSGPASTDGVGACKAGVSTCDAEGKAYSLCEGEVTPTIESCTTAADDDCDGVAPACTGDCLWSARFGDPAFEEGRSIAVDAAGNVVIVGNFQGTIDLGGGALTSQGGSDIFVVALSPSGAHLWSHSFGNADEQQVSSVAFDAAGNVLITGTMSGVVDFGGGPLKESGFGDLFVVKLSSNGQHLWSKRFGNNLYQGGTSIAGDVSGNVLLTGTMLGLMDLGGGSLFGSAFVAKLGPSGEHVWSKTLGPETSSAPWSIAVNGAGHILLAGNFFNSIDFGAGPLKSAGGYDAFIAELGPDGAPIWSRTFGDAAFQNIESAAFDPAGNAVIAGTFFGSFDLGGVPLTSAGNADAFLAKLDTSGNVLWSKTIGDPGHQAGHTTAVDAAGNITIAGDFAGTVDLGGGPLTSTFGDDVFLAKLDPAGKLIWGKRYGDTNDQIPEGLALDAAGSAHVTGKFMKAIDFCGAALVSAGDADAFVVKLAP